MKQSTLVSQVINLSAPNAIAQLIRLLTAFIATIMVSRLGILPLAANALGYTVYLILLLFFMGIAYAISILAGKLYGAKNKDGLADLLRQCIWTSFILAVPVIIVLRFAGDILLLFGQDPKLVVLAQGYLDGLSWGAWPLILSISLQLFLLGVGRAKILSFFALASLLLNVFFYYLLIFGHWGLPKLGLAGVGYSISISAGLNILLVLSYYFSQAELREIIRLKNIFHFNPSTLKNIFSIGLPISINMLSEIVAFAIVVFIIGYIDHLALAAYQVVSQIMYIPLMFPFAVSQSAAVLASQQLGKGEQDKIISITRISIVVAILPVALCSILFWLMPAQLISVFLQQHQADSQSIIRLAVQMLMLVGVFQLIEAVRLVTIGTLRGLHDVKTPLYYSLVSFWLINIILVVFVALILKFSVIFIWMATGVGTIVGTTLVLKRLAKQKHFNWSLHDAAKS